MKRVLVLMFCLVFTMTFLASTALADKTMDRIEKTGKIPFAYVDPKVGTHVGFSVDMGYYIADLLSERFNKKIEVEHYTVTAKTRIPMVINETIDLEMGFATRTQMREEVVDFSIIWFFSESTFLVPKDSDIYKLEDLNGKRIGAARGTTNLMAVERLVDEGKIKPKDILVVETHPQGFLALRGGKVDAYTTDRSVLEGLRLKAPDPENWRITDFATTYDPYGYIVKEGESDIRDFVNNAIIWAIKTGKFYEIYDKWMGPDAATPLPMSDAYRNYLEMICWPIEDEWWKKK
jgi:ABC-type amino acid transport substrate-binding protein